MKNPIQELREILESVPAIKSDFEKLSYGAKVEFEVYPGYRKAKFVSQDWKTRDILVTKCNPGFHPERVKEENILKVEHPLEERHLRIFCAANREKFHCFTEMDKISLFKFGPKKDQKTPLEVEKSEGFILDLSKSFNEQSDEFFQGVVDFLKSE